MKKTTLIVLVLVGVLTAAGVYFAARGAERRPNVVLISIDSLRADHLSAYGYRRETSPNIDRLAREGALFENVVSTSSWTLPAHAALFTALPDRVHGCFDDERWLDGSRETLAEALEAAGYSTVGFFSGPYLHPSFGLSQGFDSYTDCSSYARDFIDKIQRGEHLSERKILEEGLMHSSHEDVTNPIILKAVADWLESAPDGPFFLFIHMWDVHFDYLPPPPFDRKFDPDYSGPVDGRNVLAATRRPEAWSDRDVDHLRALYDGEIAWTDATIGQILDFLDRRGLKDNSIIAVTSDHGEAFYEHGVFGHRWTLFDEEVRIPLIVRLPDAIPGGVRVSEAVSIVDVAPTLLDFAAAPPLPHAWGRSLRPLLEKSPWQSEDAVLELNVPAHQGKHLFALRSAQRKTLFDLKRRQISAYDLVKDPGETKEAAGTELEPLLQLYQAVSKRLEEAAARLPAIGERDTPPIDRMTEEELRKHGYLR